MGYYVRPIFALDLDNADPTRRRSQIVLVHFEETWPLILIPIATGFTGIILVLFGVAWFGGSRKWARTLNIVRHKSLKVGKANETGQFQFPCDLRFDCMGRFWDVYPDDQGDQW
jgi:hypothetical protein